MAKEQNLKKSASEFNIIGKPILNDFTFDLDKVSASGWKYSRFNLGIDCGQSGVIYSEMMGGYSTKGGTKVYAHGKKKNDDDRDVDDFKSRIEIDWADRLNEKVLDKLGERCFIKVGIERDASGKTFTKKFVSEYDAIKYIKEHLTEDDVLNVKGGIEYQYYEGNIFAKKTITSIYISRVESQDDFKATFKQTVLFDKDVVKSKYNVDTESTLLEGYVVQYIGKIDGEVIKENFTLPFNFELKFKNEGNKEKNQKLINKFLKPKGAKAISEVTLEGIISKGAAEVTIKIDDLPEEIQDLIEMGAMSEEEALKKAIGNNKSSETFIAQNPEIRRDKDGNVVIQYNPERYQLDDLNMIEARIANGKEETKEEEFVDIDLDEFDFDELMKD